MITARIETQSRIVPVSIPNDKDEAIKCLQNAVYTLNPEDGSCRFVVLDGGHEIYFWNYQPTFREELKKAEKPKKEDKYILCLVYYVLLNGKELSYDNLYMDGEFFYTIKQARDFMKDRGRGRYDYQIVYEYSVCDATGDRDYGFGMGFSREEAKEKLNKSLSVYDLTVDKYGKIKEI